MAGSFICFVPVADDLAVENFGFAFKDSSDNTVFFYIYKNTQSGLFEFDKFRVSSSLTEFISSPMIHLGLSVEFTGINDNVAGYSVSYDDSLSFLASSNIDDFVSSSVSGGSSTVDLSSVLDAISALDTKVSNIDFQFPENFNFIEQSLNGNGSRYKDGEEVKVANVPGDFKVVSSVLGRSDSNIYTVVYKLNRKLTDDVFGEVHYVPEALVYTLAEITSETV